MPKRVYPVPEIILGERIDVRDGVGSMDNEARIMRVPLLDTPACRHVRAHEMAHAKYSPKNPLAPKGIHQTVIQRVEDMRMNVHCRNQGLHKAMDAPIIEDRAMWERLLTDEMNILTAGISTFDTGDWDEFVNRTLPREEDIEFISSLHERMKDNPVWDKTLELSQTVMDYLNGEPPPESGDGTGESEDSESQTGDPGDSESDSDIEPEDMAEIDLTTDRMDRMVDAKMEDEVRKAEMTPVERGIEELKRMKCGSKDATIKPMVVTVQKMPKRLPPSKFKSRAKVPADMGMVPKHMNRYCTDKAIFAGRGRKRSRGGTILIDASGSMHIYEHDIDAIMNECPLGTIATYSGDIVGEETQGDLYVIAKNGNRAVENLRPRGQMNLVDVPALQWMVKQDGPYYWVCDGIVTGGGGRYGEMQAENISDMCIELVEDNDIIMVPTLAELAKVIHGK
jgi:hypothetical protein